MPQHAHFNPFVFQLTASRRGWRDSQISFFSLLYFNSQPHEEADISPFSSYPPPRAISTHSLTKRLTRDTNEFMTAVSVFQLTASRRGWQRRQKEFDAREKFQLTASRRGWQPDAMDQRTADVYFNSQPHEEADENRKWYLLCRSDVYFNSQPHEEAD